MEPQRTPAKTPKQNTQFAGMAEPADSVFAMAQNLVLCVSAKPESGEAVSSCTHVSDATEQQARCKADYVEAGLWKAGQESAHTSCCTPVAVSAATATTFVPSAASIFSTQVSAARWQPGGIWLRRYACQHIELCGNLAVVAGNAAARCGGVERGSLPRELT